MKKAEEYLKEKGVVINKDNILDVIPRSAIWIIKVMQEHAQNQVEEYKQQLAEKDKEIELDKLILDGERVFYKKRIKELEEQLNQKPLEFKIIK